MRLDSEIQIPNESELERQVSLISISNQVYLKENLWQECLSLKLNFLIQNPIEVFLSMKILTFWEPAPMSNNLDPRLL